MKKHFFTVALAALSTLAVSAASQAEIQNVREISLYTTISESRPEVIDFGAPTYVEMMDVNWRGAHGSQSVMSRIYADGVEVWSGMIPAYDPTFRTTIRREVRQIEIRIDRGSAYANWAKLYIHEAIHQNDPQGPAFIGSVTEADKLARQLVYTLRDVQEKTSPDAIRASVLPLKIAAAKVFAIANASGSLHQSDVYRAVLALEKEFQAQESFIISLLDANDTYDNGLTLMTIRERYKALFGSVHY